MLGGIVPPAFKNRALDDLGCGDGKLTVLLKDVFMPEKLRGFDINPALVRRARSMGIQAEVKDLEASLPGGELAVMWGVLHHMKDMDTCLKRLKESYAMAFIREPVRNLFIKGLELGRPLPREEIEHLIQKHMPSAQTFYYGHCIFIFYMSSK